MASSRFFVGEGFFTMVTFFGGCYTSAADVPLVGLLIEIFRGGSPWAGYYSSLGLGIMGSRFEEGEASVKLDCCCTTLTGLFDSKPLPTGGGLPKSPFKPSNAGSWPGRDFFANSAFCNTSMMLAELDSLL